MHVVWARCVEACCGISGGQLKRRHLGGGEVAWAAAQSTQQRGAQVNLSWQRVHRQHTTRRQSDRSRAGTPEAQPPQPAAHAAVLCSTESRQPLMRQHDRGLRSLAALKAAVENAVGELGGPAAQLLVAPPRFHSLRAVCSHLACAPLTLCTDAACAQPSTLPRFLPSFSSLAPVGVRAQCTALADILPPEDDAVQHNDHERDVQAGKPRSDPYLCRGCTCICCATGGTT